MLVELVVAELAAEAGQAERERDLMLAKKLAELDRREAVHELRLQQLEQNVRERLASLRDGEKGERGEKGEKGDQVQGEKGDQGPAGEQGEKGEKGDGGAAGEKGQDGANGADGIGRDGKDGERGEPGERGGDGRSFRIRDTYDPAERYEQCDVVTLNATWFVARADDPGPCPGAGWKAGPTARRGEKGERGERGPRGEPQALRIVEWDIRAKTYEAFPLLSDGTLGPPIPLRALFEQFQAETA